VAPVEDPMRIELLLDQLRSLRAALVVVAVIAVAGLAVAIYAELTKEEESDTHAGASRTRVVALSDRVDALESDLKSRATKDDVSTIASDQKSLGARVDQLTKQAASTNKGGTDQQARSSIDQINQNIQTLSQSVKDLDTRVHDLEQQQQSSSSSP
jgi:peptidoglycan hydrolase CwlO-like protein